MLFWRIRNKIKNLPVIFPFIIVLGRSTYQAGTFCTGVGIQVIIITYIVRILAVIFMLFWHFFTSIIIADWLVVFVAWSNRSAVSCAVKTLNSYILYSISICVCFMCKLCKYSQADKIIRFTACLNRLKEWGALIDCSISSQGRYFILFRDNY